MSFENATPGLNDRAIARVVYKFTCPTSRVLQMRAPREE
jgi:hypothetical protein